MESEAKSIVTAKNALKAEKASYASLCDELSNYYCPEIDVLSTTSEGSEIIQPITSTGVVATTRLQNGLYSNTMAMGKGNIGNSDKKVMQIPIAKDWYSELSNVTQHHVSQSGFPKKFQVWLGDYCNFGGSIMYPEFDKGNVRHKFFVYPENSCFYTQDEDGTMTSMYREYALTAEQAVNKFGEKELTDKIREAYEKRDEKTTFNFVHCLRPNRTRKKNRTDSKNKKFESIHVLEMGDHKIVKKSGTDQFRYVSEHFYQKQGEKSGRAPTMQALPVLRTLAKVVDLLMMAKEMSILPPIWFPDKNAAETAMLEPGFVGYFDPSKGNPFVYQIDPAVIRENQELYYELKKEVDELFFVDLFAMLEQQKTGAKTAYEISQLVAERTQAIAPVANSLSGFFRKVYTIVAKDLVEAKQVSDPPQEVMDAKGEGVDLDVVYTSRLDIRLKEIETVAMLEGVNQAAQFTAAVESNPTIRACVKPIKGVLSIFESQNLTTDVTNNEDEANQELAKMQKAAADAKQAEQAAQSVKPVDLQAPVQENSPMSSMIGDEASGFTGI